MELMAQHGFFQLVTKPTTDYVTTLDHVYYNGNKTMAIIDVVDTYYSDHDKVFLSVQIT